MAALRPRSEETAGRAEPLLATGLSRARWVGGHLAVAMGGGTVVLLLAGLGFGIAGAASTGDAGLLPDLVGAALAYAPALWVTVGVAVVLFGWFPQASQAAWIVPVYAFVVGYLGQILQFPGWMNNLSRSAMSPGSPPRTSTGPRCSCCPSSPPAWCGWAWRASGDGTWRRSSRAAAPCPVGRRSRRGRCRDTRPRSGEDTPSRSRKHFGHNCPDAAHLSA
ncbi:hypothetical protein SHIRM173S_07680 [Streptomyces hirsutus]